MGGALRWLQLYCKNALEIVFGALQKAFQVLESGVEPVRIGISDWKFAVGALRKGISDWEIAFGAGSDRYFKLEKRGWSASEGYFRESSRRRRARRSIVSTIVWVGNGWTFTPYGQPAGTGVQVSSRLV